MNEMSEMNEIVNSSKFSDTVITVYDWDHMGYKIDDISYDPKYKLFMRFKDDDSYGIVVNTHYVSDDDDKEYYVFALTNSEKMLMGKIVDVERHEVLVTEDYLSELKKGCRIDIKHIIPKGFAIDTDEIRLYFNDLYDSVNVMVDEDAWLDGVAYDDVKHAAEQIGKYAGDFMGLGNTCYQIFVYFEKLSRKMTKKEVLKLKEQGLSLEEIAGKLNLKDTEVRNIVVEEEEMMINVTNEECDFKTILTSVPKDEDIAFHRQYDNFKLYF